MALHHEKLKFLRSIFDIFSPLCGTGFALLAHTDYYMNVNWSVAVWLNSKLNLVTRGKSLRKLAYKILFHVKSLKASVEFIRPKFFILKISPHSQRRRQPGQDDPTSLPWTLYSANAQENRAMSR